MTINLTLGASWIPKIAGICGAIGVIGGHMPDTLPGAHVIKPWCIFIGEMAVPLLGFSVRQNNVPTEAVPTAVAKQAAIVAQPKP